MSTLRVLSHLSWLDIHPFFIPWGSLIELNCPGSQLATLLLINQSLSTNNQLNIKTTQPVKVYHLRAPHYCTMLHCGATSKWRITMHHIRSLKPRMRWLSTVVSCCGAPWCCTCYRASSRRSMVVQCRGAERRNTAYNLFQHGGAQPYHDAARRCTFLSVCQWKW